MTVKPHQKKKRIKLSKDAYVKLVHEIWESQYRRCRVCQKYLQPEDAHPHHRKTKGSGGDDSKSYIIILCVDCHYKKHTGEI